MPILENIHSDERINLITPDSDAVKPEAHVQASDDEYNTCNDARILFFVSRHLLHRQDDSDSLVSIYSEANRLAPGLSNDVHATADSLAAPLSVRKLPTTFNNHKKQCNKDDDVGDGTGRRESFDPSYPGEEHKHEAASNSRDCDVMGLFFRSHLLDYKVDVRADEVNVAAAEQTLRAGD